MKHLISHNRYILQRIGIVALVFIVLQVLLRIAFLVWEFSNINFSTAVLAKTFGMGLVYDIATFSYFLIPYMLYLVFLPRRLHLSVFDAIITTITYALVVYLLLFDTVAEWVFWDEFSVRFNFIAVDYLVYTQEVLANIWQSYPIVWILSALALIAAVIFYFTRHLLIPSHFAKVAKFGTRLTHGAIYTLIPVIAFVSLNLGDAEVTKNNYANEITKNGIYSLFAAFLDNELSYKKFYLSDYDGKPLPSIRSLVTKNQPDAVFSNDNPDDITRYIRANGPERHKNVIIVTMESMSGSYMAHFGNTEGNTPVLDALADESLFFSNTYATGTRTVRGLEAISLSIPPSPGRSIVKRPNNENLSTIGWVFKERGYDTKFIYGGYGYFDNMNYYFSHNGFDIVDRSEFADNEQTFANAWGLCDEDLFKKVIKEANKSYAEHKPFMDIVMTTSNHRPYTFPENAAGVPTSGGGRLAGVRYADYAVGEFLKAAKKEPWFKDTIFVFVADHTAGSAGKVELTVQKYHIPLIIYAPEMFQPQEIKRITSQIDIAPTLLGLLDFSYYSRFYGENVMAAPDKEGRAFIANYQKLGFLTDGALAILKPGKKYAEYRDNKLIPDSDINEQLLLETIAYYKHAAAWEKHVGRIKTVKESK